MTMFSMKPKFNLAEFLATPAPAGASRFAGGRRRAAPVQPAARTEEAATPAPTGDSEPTDK
ncbi:hypothetical protein [Pararhodobacter sp. SW119]|uniref:hypothetical protein n=1 Tax=Pararhodobacter sp. SW119 TaxID=2780075 RepID=UPI001ADECCD1|nr:hypothetical protein [Pararhodobacter sp. SW119]